MRWIDLSPYDAKIELLHLIKPDHEIRGLLITGAAEDMAEALAWLRFRPISADRAVWFSDARSVDLDRFVRVFPEAPVIDVAAEAVTRVADQRPAAAPPAPVQSASVQSAPAQPAPAAPAAQEQPAATPQAPSDTAAERIAAAGIQDLPQQHGWDADAETSAADTGGHRLALRNTPDDSRMIYSVNGHMIRQMPDGHRYYRRPQDRAWLSEARDNISAAAALRVTQPGDLAGLLKIHFTRVAQDQGNAADAHRDFLQAVELDITDPAIAKQWNEQAILWSREQATSPRGGLNIRHFYDNAVRMTAPGMPGLSAPAAIAMFRSVRSLPRQDRNKMVTIWSPTFNDVMDIRCASLPSYRPHKQLEAGRVAIADLTAGTAAIEPVTIDGITTDRTDRADLLRILETREPDGKTFVIWRLNGADPEGEAAFWRELACRYAVEGRADLDRSLIDFGGDRARLFILASRRPEILDEPHEASMRPARQIDAWHDLWGWTSEVMVNREKINRYYDTSGADSRNILQVAYTPLSKAATHEMVPKNLEMPIRRAQQNFKKRHDDIDAYVQGILEVPDQKTLFERFSASQIDAIGMFCDAFERGFRGVGNFDQTGMGKGRFCAAMAQIAATGRLPNRPDVQRALVFTEREINMDDLIKDMRDTGMFEREGVKVGIFNANVVTRNHLTREEERHSVPSDVMREAIRNKTWPEGYDVLIVTYSQFNRSPMIENPDYHPRRDPESQKYIPDTSLAGMKAAWLQAVVDDSVAVIRDESHNGSVSSTTGRNLTAALENAGAVVDSSGSYARSLDEIVQYKHLFPPSVAGRDMVSILRRGGEPVITAMIASAASGGNVIRREHNAMRRIAVMSRPTEAEREDYRLKKDALATVLSEIAYMTGHTAQRVNEANQALINSYLDDNPEFVQMLQRLDAADQGNAVERLIGTLPSIKMRNIGSAKYAIAKLFVASLSIRKTVELAIDALQRGRKPIIVVETTGEAILKAMVDAGDTDADGRVDIQFRDMLYRLVRNSITGEREVDTEANRRIRQQNAEQQRRANLLRRAERGDEVPYQEVAALLEAEAMPAGQRGNQAEAAAPADGEAPAPEGDGAAAPMLTPAQARLARRAARRLARQEKLRMRREKFLATTQRPETMRGYVGAKARRLLIANPELPAVLDADDKPAVARMVRDALAEAASLAIRRGYVEDEYLQPLLAALQEEAVAALEADQRTAREQINTEDAPLSRLMPLLPLDLAAYLVRVEDLIETLPDTPCNVIDEIKAGIRAAGYSIGEITGRTIEVVDGVVQPRTDTDRASIRDRFNGYGDRLNALIANKTGLTGLNFNSCEMFPDKDPRTIIYHEIMQDPISMIQADGRIARMNNITDPEIIVPLLDLVCQQYMIAMTDKKLGVWSAGITASRDNPIALREVPDMFNIIGDHVATDYLKSHPEMATRLGMELTTEEIDEQAAGLQHWRQRIAPAAAPVIRRRQENQIDERENHVAGAADIARRQQEAELAGQAARPRGEAVGDLLRPVEGGNNPLDLPGEQGDQQRRRGRPPGRGSRTQFSQNVDVNSNRALYRMSTLMQRLIMLPDSEEQAVMEHLKCEYEAAVAELDAQGRNPLRTQFIDAKLHIINSVPLSGIEGTPLVAGDPEGNGFSDPVRLDHVAFEFHTPPIRSDELERLVARQTDMSAQLDRLATEAEDHVMRYYRQFPNMPVEEEIERGGSPRLLEIRNEVNNVRWAIDNIRPGRRIDVSVDGDRRVGIVISLMARTNFHEKMSSYEVQFVVPGDAEPRTMNLKSLLADPDFDAMPGLESDERDQALADFDAANDTLRVARRLMLNGNLWESMAYLQEYRIGHLVSWEGENRTIERGVLLNRNVRPHVIPMPVMTSAVIDFMEEGRMEGRDMLSNNFADVLPENESIRRSLSVGRAAAPWPVKILKRRGRFEVSISSQLSSVLAKPEVAAILADNVENVRGTAIALRNALAAGIDIDDETIRDYLARDVQARQNANNRLIGNRTVSERIRTHAREENVELARRLEVLDADNDAGAEERQTMIAEFRNLNREHTAASHASSKDSVRAVLDQDTVKRLVDLLIANGVRLYADGALRDVLVAATQQAPAMPELLAEMAPATAPAAEQAEAPAPAPEDDDPDAAPAQAA